MGLETCVQGWAARGVGCGAGARKGSGARERRDPRRVGIRLRRRRLWLGEDGEDGREDGRWGAVGAGADGEGTSGRTPEEVRLCERWWDGWEEGRVWRRVPGPPQYPAGTRETPQRAGEREAFERALLAGTRRLRGLLGGAPGHDVGYVVCAVPELLGEPPDLVGVRLAALRLALPSVDVVALVCGHPSLLLRGGLEESARRSVAALADALEGRGRKGRALARADVEGMFRTEPLLLEVEDVRGCLDALLDWVAEEAARPSAARLAQLEVCDVAAEMAAIDPAVLLVAAGEYVGGPERSGPYRQHLLTAALASLAAR